MHNHLHGEKLHFRKLPIYLQALVLTCVVVMKMIDSAFYSSKHGFENENFALVTLTMFTKATAFHSECEISLVRFYEHYCNNKV